MNRQSGFLIRLRALFRKRRLDADMDEEMRTHLEMRTRQNVEAGMPREEARFAALRQFGSSESIKETCRDLRSVRWLEGLIRDCWFAFRMLRKTPGFSAIAILTMALGIGANLALFTLIDDEFLRPRPVRRPDQLWAIIPADETGKPRFFNFSKPYFDAIRTANGIFADLISIQGVSPKLRTPDGWEEILGHMVTANYFDFIGIHPSLGRGFIPEEDRPGAAPVAVVSDRFWREHFPGKTVVAGQTLNLNGHSFEIIGVAPPGFVGMSSARPDFLIPYGTSELFFPSPPQNPIARLRDGVSPSGVEDLLAPLVREVTRTLHPVEYSLLNTPMEAGNNSKFARIALLRAGYGSANRQSAYEGRVKLIQVNSLAGLGTLLVLFLAAGNLANLLLARGFQRRREIATRIALGATRVTLVRQLALEGAVLAALGTLAAAFMLNWFGNLAPSLMSAVVFNAGSPVNFHPDFRITAFAAGMALLIGIASALPPALISANLAPFTALRDSGTGTGTRGHWWSLRATLVIAQISGSLVILSSVLLCLRAINDQLHGSVGFQPEPLVVASINLEKAGYDTNTAPPMCQALRAKLLALPGVERVGLIDGTPFSGERGGLVTDRVRRHEGIEVEHQRVHIGPGFFEAMGIPLLAGREVSENDFTSRRDVALVNETFVRNFWPREEVLGWQVEEFRRRTFEIIGIVADTRLESPMIAPKPTVYYSANEHDALHPTFILRAKLRPEALIQSIRSELIGIHPLLRGSQILTMTDAMRRPFEPQRKVMNLLGEIAVVALGLTLLGVYGLVSFLVTQRTREFGIRLAVGARRADIRKLILKLGLLLTTAGLALGLPMAFGGSFLLRHVVSEVRPLDLMSFAIGAGGVALTVLIACYLPAQRAGKVDPMVALRHE